MEKSVLCLNNQDARQRYLARMLMEDGTSVVLCEEFCPDLGKYDVVLLPVVLKGLDLEKIADQLREGQRVFGGNFPEDFHNICVEKRVRCYDYMKEETIALKNGVATAEGALARAISLGDENLHNHSCLVIGYGRCGSILAQKLRGMGGQVSVLEENVEKQARAQVCGFRTIQSPWEISAGGYSYLFNTAPSQILGKTILKELERDIVIIDIASGKGGVDYEYCREKGIRAEHCLGLPGKYAPKTSAEILYEYIRKNADKGGVL